MTTATTKTITALEQFYTEKNQMQDQESLEQQVQIASSDLELSKDKELEAMAGGKGGNSTADAANNETFALAANRPDRIRDSMNLSKLLRISGLATLLVGTSILVGPAVAHAQDCSSPAPEGENITLAPPVRGGGGGAGVGEASAKLTHVGQNSGDYVAAQVCAVSAKNPGKNIMIIQHETYDGPDNLTGVTQDYDIEIAGNGFDVFAFDTGSFTNNGDLGYQNWAWRGTGWTRSEDKRTVTFSAP